MPQGVDLHRNRKDLVLVSASKEFLDPLWWMVVFPGLAITLTILSFNLFGDALRDHMDPRLRGQLD